jgi:hypothetical protein
MHADLRRARSQGDPSLHLVRRLNLAHAGQDGPGQQACSVLEGVRHDPARGADFLGKEGFDFSDRQKLLDRHGYLPRELSEGTATIILSARKKRSGRRRGFASLSEAIGEGKCSHRGGAIGMMPSSFHF